MHSLRNVSKEGERVAVAPSPDDGRRPQTRPDVNRSENPEGLLLTTDERANLVGLKFLDGQSSDCSIVESMTGVGGPFEPAIDRVPGDSLDARNGGLVQAFDAEGGDFVEGRATMLESMVRRPGVGAEGLAASPASVPTTPSPFRPVEAVTDDSSGSGISRQRAFPVYAAETLHCSWTGRPQDWWPGIEPQIVAGTGVTVGPPTVDDVSTGAIAAPTCAGQEAGRSWRPGPGGS